MSSQSGGIFHWEPGNKNCMNQFIEEERCWLQISDAEGEDRLSKLKYREVMTKIPKHIKTVTNIKFKNKTCNIQVPKVNRDEVLSIDTLDGIKVKITEQVHRNTKKGTIYHDSIEEYDQPDLLEDLKQFNDNIVSVQIQKFWKDEKLCNSKSAIVTFDLVNFPLNFKIKLFYEFLNVRIYYPDPMLCRKCWGYNHRNSKTKPCTNQEKCGSCGKDFHLDREDNGRIKGKCNTEKCLNCLGEHCAWDRKCPS